MSPRRSKSLGASVVFAVALLLAGCGQSAPSGAASGPTKVLLGGTADPQISTQMILADKLGYFKDERLDVDLKLFNTGPELTQAVAAGSISIFGTSSVPAWNFKSSGADIKILAQQADMSGAFGIAANSNVHVPKDLEGKSIALVPASGLEMLYLAVAKEYNLDAAKIKVVNLGAADAITALQRHDIDAAVTFEPWMIKAKAVGAHMLLTANYSNVPGQEGPHAYYGEHSVILSTAAFLKSHGTTVEAILRALTKAQTFLDTSLDKAVPLVADALKQSPADMNVMMRENRYQMVVNDQLASDYQSVGEFLVSKGKIKGPATIASWIAPNPLKSVKSDWVTWRA